ncbi:RagB/SusD family nutrient uptake outer membrane protein [Prevotella sp. PINT]|jgi:SusD family.|uniref:RagB/SusD family nutrient uptake outer membrane protein n=1 Tax=Palleniella intestinalis TaxID=2736291 RepID=UPI001557D1CE|nr:RagB/SusD family nutrient uptake outer membrane protein [Palleniella intestinalis]NPD81504.1 RagB/SusD family nutrient uptake outer membrane protein [Palleniella intestinalis]
MKATKYIAMGLLATSVMLTTACSDSFLEVENPSGEPLEEYYTTDAHIQEALYAAYDPTHWPDWGLGQYNALNIDAEVMGDNFWVGGANKGDMATWHKLFNFEANENETFSSLWTVDYSGIKRCNDVLKYIPWGTDVTPENAKSYEMQARALRVYYYNNLWHYFGNIPFYLTNLEGNYIAPQLPADEVYAELIRELEEVIASNVLPMRWDNTYAGKVSQAMIYMMYAEMVMYQNDQSRYAKALEYMNKIISDSQYDLVDDYASIWETSGEWSKESIWEINYTDNGNERGWGSPLAIGGTVLPTLISPPNMKPFPEHGLTQDGWGFLPMKQETYDMFEAGDTRRDATAWDLRDVPYEPRYQNTGLWLKKYRAQDANNANAVGDKNLNFNNNLRVYRYAETLLNAAELILKTGGNATTALDYVNKVRERAGIGKLSTVNEDLIIQERNYEFVGEGKRYFDLVRTGKAATVLVPDAYGYRTNSWTPNKKYIPIDQAELDSDPALKQNDY